MSQKRITLGPASQVGEGALKGYPVGKRNLLIARLGGQLKCLDDWCNHAGCLLSGGRIEGNLVICPCHEVGFDLDSGKNVTSPGVCDDQPRYDALEEGGEIVVLGYDKT
jgi:3-phenylpropionate/trans-cinnamate dioxygenase ferredoxin component